MRSICLAFALAVSGPALAAQPTAPAKTEAADPAALAAAERLMEAMNYDKLVDQMTDAMVAQAKQSMPAQIEKVAEKSEKELPADLKSKLIELVVSSMERTLRDNKASFRREVALIYARHFTVAEINRLTEIQKDPVMVKMLAEMPAIMAESMAMSQTRMAQEMPHMLDEVKKLITEYLEAHPDADAPVAPAA